MCLPSQNAMDLMRAEYTQIGIHFPHARDLLVTLANVKESLLSALGHSIRYSVTEEIRARVEAGTRIAGGDCLTLSEGRGEQWVLYVSKLKQGTWNNKKKSCERAWNFYHGEEPEGLQGSGEEEDLRKLLGHFFGRSYRTILSDITRSSRHTDYTSKWGNMKESIGRFCK